MARRKAGTSPHTRYRQAREHLANLDAQREKLERSKPRKPGKKGAKTRSLKKLFRRISAAKGQLTKARNAIARGAADRKAARLNAKRKRSEAAKRGWSKRRASIQAVPVATPTPRMRFLEERDGEAKQIFVYPPDKNDRAAIQRYWRAVFAYRHDGSTVLLREFEGRSIYDEKRRQRLPFITNLALLQEAIATGYTDFDDLYAESSWSSAA
jgi:hypothetical protein